MHLSSKSRRIITTSCLLTFVIHELKVMYQSPPSIHHSLKLNFDIDKERELSVTHFILSSVWTLYLCLAESWKQISCCGQDTLLRNFTLQRSTFKSFIKHFNTVCRNTGYTFKFVSFVKAVKRDDKSLTDDKCYKCFKYPLVHRLCSKTDPLHQL